MLPSRSTLAATAPHPPRTTRAAEIRKQAASQHKKDISASTAAIGERDGETQETSGGTAGGLAPSARRQNSASGTSNNNSAPSAHPSLAQQTSLQLKSFETILKLMDSPATAEQFDRHSSQLASLLPHLLCKPVIPARLVDPSSPLGGLAALIRKVCQVVSGTQAAAVLCPSLSQLLTLAALPIQCSTLHDQRSLPSCVAAMLKAVSLALREPHTLQIRTQAANVMRDIIRRVNDKCGVDVRVSSSAAAGGDKKSSAASGGDQHNVTTGSAIRDLSLAVTRESVLALTDAWRTSIRREYSSTVAYATKASSSGSGAGLLSLPTSPEKPATNEQPQHGRDGALSANSDYVQNLTGVSTSTPTNDTTVDGINRQLAHRDNSLEVIALLQGLTAATSVRSRARWLVTPSQERKVDVDDLVFTTLQLSDGDPRTPLCVELVWNLLQLCPEEAAFLASHNSYAVLQATLNIAVAEGHVAARRELRNDILVVFGMLADATPDSHCVETALVDLVLELGCGVELDLDRTKTQRAFKQHHTTRTEDMQMKLFAWDLLRRWCVADEKLADYTFSSRFFDALLCYIDVACENRAVVAWSTPQLLELQEHALRVLEELVRVGCTWFCAARGPAICVSYVLECPAKPASLLLHAISLLAEAAASPARRLIAGCGALPLALRLLSSVPLSRENMGRHVSCLTLIADIVDRCGEYQLEFGANNGVEILMPMLHGAVELADLGDDELMLAAVDCVWACVLGCQRNEDRFLEMGGVGALLSILDMRRVLQEMKETKAKTLGSADLAMSSSFAAASTIGAAGASKRVNNNNNNTSASAAVSLRQQKLRKQQQQKREDDEAGVEHDDDAADGDDEMDHPEDPVADTDENANFPIACLADVLLIPGASDFARRWRSPRTGRSGVQVLLYLWRMASVPTDIIKQGTISARTASKFDVGCAVLGKPSRDPLPIGEDDKQQQQQQQQSGSDAADNGEPDNMTSITTRATDPSYVARAGIVVAARDIRNIATAYRKNIKVYAALASVGYNGHHELELEERATLTTIQQFMALCKDEVWETVSSSLLSAGVEPTSADWETLRLLREAAEQRACGLQATRAAFTEMQRRQREAGEKTFYEALIKRTEERLVGGDVKSRAPGTSAVNPNDMKKRTSKFLTSELTNQRQPSGRNAHFGEDVNGGAAGLAGGAGGSFTSHAGAAGLSITEAKMRNKMMLRSSFKHPVRKTAQQQQQEGEQSAGAQDDDDDSTAQHQQQQQQQQQQRQNARVGISASNDDDENENSQSHINPDDDDDDDDDVGAVGRALRDAAAATTSLADDSINKSTTLKFSASNPSASVVFERFGPGKSAMTETEFGIFKIINAVRLDPKSFVRVFESALERYDAETGHILPLPNSNDDPIACEEGRQCIEEAIRFLNRVRPLSVLLDVPLGMLFASRDFARKAATRLDRVTDADGEETPDDRLKRYGKLEQGSRTMQLLSTGCFSPEAVLLQLVLGDGDPSRPEREALFSPDFKCISTAVTEHPVYKQIVQIMLATGYADKPAQQQRAIHQQQWSDL